MRLFGRNTLIMKVWDEKFIFMYYKLPFIIAVHIRFLSTAKQVVPGDLLGTSWLVPSAYIALLNSGCNPLRTCSSLKNHFSAPNHRTDEEKKGLRNTWTTTYVRKNYWVYLCFFSRWQIEFSFEIKKFYFLKSNLGGIINKSNTVKGNHRDNIVFILLNKILCLVCSLPSKQTILNNF